MKFLYLLTSCVLLPIIVAAQKVSPASSSIPVITINAKLIGKDSVIIPFNEKYWVVEDDCTQIIRYGHYDFKRKTFSGKFRDVKKDDSTLIVAEGNYLNGFKNGMFVLRYLDGKLMAQGAYKDDKYDGEWVFYYPNGKLKASGYFLNGQYAGKWKSYYDNAQTKLIFYADDGICKIMYAWLANGIKIVDAGNGSYQTETSSYWIGKLSNGLPDSTWVLHSNIGKGMASSVTEYFNQNKFINGHAEQGKFVNDYSDASHISLFPQLPYFEIDRAQHLDVNTGCSGKEYKEAKIKIWGKTLREKTFSMNGVIFQKD